MTIATLIGPVEFLSNFTFRTMLVGTALVGGFSGALGCFLYLRKQSLIADVIGHSAIAGVMGAFVFATAIVGVDGRSMLVLTIGATISATASVIFAQWITHHSQLTMDAAMAISLALFYGIGMVALRAIVHSSLPNRGGIDKYMFGNAATLTNEDLLTIAIFGGGALLIVLIGWKAFKVFTFDPILAQMLGFSPRATSLILAGATTIAVVIGVKSAGLILMVAFAIMPAASARQWTKRLSHMVGLATAIGAGSGVVGSYLAVNLGKVPTGPVIVLVLFTVFLISLGFAPERSVIRRYFMRRAKMRALRAQAYSEALGA
ncbi:MAG: metal ABC transporter permease [Actinomycetaceae bacterium]|nr:metal ABC transporter permease [Actinomycetaceae bacterium]